MKFRTESKPYRGRHIWNIGSSPSLPRPEIKFTRNNKCRVLLGIHPIDGAGKYRFEYSSNTGRTGADSEGELCYAVNNDPDNWVNFDPMPGEPFRKSRVPSKLPSGKYNLEDSKNYYPE